MSQYQRMIEGKIYDPMDPEITSEQKIYQEKVYEFNQLKPYESEEKQKYMHEVFAECGENCYIELPFHANWGGHHLHLGSGVYMNFNMTMVDDGNIYIGNKVMFGPNVTIITGTHPVNPSLREKGLQYNKDVYIEDNAWIGSGVTILPGVKIGKNSVIAAGSMVTKDIPENVVAAGIPCKVMRKIGEHDDRYYDRDKEIDWENLTEE